MRWEKPLFVINPHIDPSVSQGQENADPWWSVLRAIVLAATLGMAGTEAAAFWRKQISDGQRLLPRGVNCRRRRRSPVNHR